MKGFGLSDRWKNYTVEKEWKNKYSSSDFLLHNTLRQSLNLKKLAQIGYERSVTEISIREKEKWTYKGINKKEMAYYF